ncbi:MAG: hypothetical protein HY482_02545 [Candidatus Wildermuthbacteria bacterium]|nr:hypothetical protein [Candidatus Wildermuthbacteria bacterium]
MTTLLSISLKDASQIARFGGSDPLNPPSMGVGPVAPIYTPIPTIPPEPVITPLKVEWSEPFYVKSIADLPPTLPAGKGFVRDGLGHPYNPRSSPEAMAYLQKIKPALFVPDISPYDGRPSLVLWAVTAGKAQDPANPNVILAGFSVHHFKNNMKVGDRVELSDFLFLSTNGGESWYQITPFTSSPGYPPDIWVTQQEKNIVIILYDFQYSLYRKAILHFPQSLP